jgi:hypothetical protein
MFNKKISTPRLFHASFHACGVSHNLSGQRDANGYRATPNLVPANL